MRTSPAFQTGVTIVRFGWAPFDKAGNAPVNPQLSQRSENPLALSGCVGNRRRKVPLQSFRRCGPILAASESGRFPKPGPGSGTGRSSNGMLGSWGQ